MNPRRRTKGRKAPKSRRLGRLLRRWRPDRNPLRRGSDRAEIALLGLLLAVFLAAAPFVEHSVQSWTYTTSGREAQVQQATLHEVSATLLQAAPEWNGFANSPGAAPEVSARWRAPDGQLRTGKLLVPNGAPAGSTVKVWTNQAGQLTDPPLQRTQVVSRSQLTGGLAVAGLAIVLIVVGWLARRMLDRRRMAEWDEDWLVTGPRWSPRR
jgi:hypothetical protein